MYTVSVCETVNTHSDSWVTVYEAADAVEGMIRENTHINTGR